MGFGNFRLGVANFTWQASRNKSHILLHELTCQDQAVCTKTFVWVMDGSDHSRIWPKIILVFFSRQHRKGLPKDMHRGGEEKGSRGKGLMTTMA